MPGTLFCPSDISTDGGVPVCSSAWEVQPFTPPFDPSQLDPTVLAQAFGAGFTLVATFMVMSMGIRAFLNFIKQS